MRRSWYPLLALAIVLGLAASASAQTTGSINGIITDNTSAVLPGVTVTATSPSMMGSQTSVSNEQGQYRFPAVPPGSYKLVYELPGFATITREGIVVNLGFTATVNVSLQMASLQESVTVTGESPVIDVTSTTSTFNFTSQMLDTLPNARDIWSAMGQAPGFRVSSIDVGGSRAGTQTGFEAFGFSGQVRTSVDGVNTTEGTGSAGFYYDYGSFEEIQLAADGNDASSATPGVQLNAVIKSGGNTMRGILYQDYEDESFAGNNIDDRLRGFGLGQGAHMVKYYDTNGDIGGPIRKDKIWYYVSLRRQDNNVTVTGFPVENPGDFVQLTSLQNGTYKVSYQMSQNNKLSHYIQYGRKVLPERGGSSTLYRYGVFNQDSGSWAGNLEWSSIVSPSFYFRMAGSSFGYNWPNLPYGPNGELNENLDHRMLDDGSGTTFTRGSAAADRNDRRRWQFNWDGTYFKDGWAGGNHSLKFGILSERESQFFKDEGFVDEQRLHFRSPTGAAHFTTPFRVQIYNTPNAATNANWHHAAYLNDSWSIANRVTLSLGVRWDYYSSFFPDQEILPGRYTNFFYLGAPLQTSIGAFSLPATSYGASGKAPGISGIRRYPSLIAPRAGFSWDLSGDGKTVVKANWGRFHHNTGNASGTLNPVTTASATFDWLDCRNGTTPIACSGSAAGDRIFTLNELGQNRAVAGIGGVSSTIDPNLKNPYTDSMSFWFERQLFPSIGFRAGYTFRTDKNNNVNVQLARVASLYTLQRSIADPGVDGIAGNSDDGPNFIWYDIPGVAPVSRTETRTIESILATDKAMDFTVIKRMSNRWSLVTSFYYNWDRDRGFVQNPNQERFNDGTVTNWNFKMSGTYMAPWDIVVTPSLRHQSGNNLSRDINVSGTGFNITGTYEAEPNDAYRGDNITVTDVRFERRFRFGKGHVISAFFDGFNLLNSNAANVGGVSGTVGRPTVTVNGQRVQVQGFLRPTAIIPPRVFRIGTKLTF